MKYKKKIVLFFIFLFLIVGCAKKESTVLKEEFTKKVEIFEKNKIATYRREISIEEYEERIKGSFDKLLENRVVAIMRVIINEEKEKEYTEKFKTSGYKLDRIPEYMIYNVREIESEIEVYIVDNIFDGMVEGEKRVYLKKFTKFYFEGELLKENVSTIYYNFKNIDGKWKITEIRNDSESLDGLSIRKRKSVINDMDYSLTTDYIELFKIDRK